MEPGARADVLARIGTHIASRYRDDYDYFTGNFRYSTREVRKILERGALYEERTRTDTERLDLDEGVALLRKRNPRYAELIGRSEEHTSELQSRENLVCRLLLDK